MRNVVISLLLLAVGCVSVKNVNRAPTFAYDAKFTLRVVDETGNALENVQCDVVFNTYDESSALSMQLKSEFTNQDGECTFEGESSVGNAMYYIRPETPYKAAKGLVKFPSVSGLLFKQWEPYGQVITVMLERVK